MNFSSFKKETLKDPKVKKEYDALGPEYDLIQTKIEEKTKNDNYEEDYSFAKAIATVSGVEPSKDAERIMKLYSKGEIDYETACSKIKGLFTKYKVNNEK